MRRVNNSLLPYVQSVFNVVPVRFVDAAAREQIAINVCIGPKLNHGYL
jgi:hypothetical protein